MKQTHPETSISFPDDDGGGQNCLGKMFRALVKKFGTLQTMIVMEKGEHMNI